MNSTALPAATNRGAVACHRNSHHRDIVSGTATHTAAFNTLSKLSKEMFSRQWRTGRDDEQQWGRARAWNAGGLGHIKHPSGHLAVGSQQEIEAVVVVPSSTWPHWDLPQATAHTDDNADAKGLGHPWHQGDEGSHKAAVHTTDHGVAKVWPPPEGAAQPQPGVWVGANILVIRKGARARAPGGAGWPAKADKERAPADLSPRAPCARCAGAGGAGRGRGRARRWHWQPYGRLSLAATQVGLRGAGKPGAASWALQGDVTWGHRRLREQRQGTEDQVAECLPLAGGAAPSAQPGE